MGHVLTAGNNIIALHVVYSSLWIESHPLAFPTLTLLRSWAEPCPAGKCWCWYTLLCARMELSDDLWIWPKVGVSWCPVHHDERIHYSSSRRDGEHESGKISMTLILK